MSGSWRPGASFAALRLRAEVLARVRAFFAARGVLEVQTPLLGRATATDPHLASFAVEAGEGQRRWLQTSPELHMKRLLAAGSGPIYQITRAFRRGEVGRLHNPEFTILEWYRPGWDHHALMEEVDALLGEVLGTPPGERRAWAEVFSEAVGVDPLTAGAGELAAAARDLLGAGAPDLGDDRDGWLQLLVATAVEPRLGRGRPTFVVGFPASQAALARLDPRDPRVAERFEVYVEGVELANGYHELTDPGEHRRRFAADLEARRARGLPEVPVDGALLAALEAGLPACAGVALGLDRLVMLAAGGDRLDAVLAFPWDRA